MSCLVAVYNILWLLQSAFAVTLQNLLLPISSFTRCHCSFFCGTDCNPFCSYITGVCSKFTDGVVVILYSSFSGFRFPIFNFTFFLVLGDSLHLASSHFKPDKINMKCNGTFSIRKGVRQAALFCSYQILCNALPIDAVRILPTIGAGVAIKLFTHVGTAVEHG